jgi:hypothetical protein
MISLELGENGASVRPVSAIAPIRTADDTGGDRKGPQSNRFLTEQFASGSDADDLLTYCRRPGCVSTECGTPIAQANRHCPGFCAIARRCIAPTASCAILAESPSPRGDVQSRGHLYELHKRIGPHFAHHIEPVHLYRVRGYAKIQSNLLVQLPGHYLLHDFTLART